MNDWRARCASAIVGVVLMIAAVACDPRYASPAEDEWKAGTHEHSVNVHDVDRDYVLHVPAIRPRNRLAIPVGFPLVFVLHGSGASGETVRDQSGMDHLADSLHFLVAYPNGSRRIFGLGSDWNAGTCCGNAARSGIDDIGFVQAIAADVGRRFPIDQRRIYVAGFSDGGRMAYHMGCDASAVIAAIGIVSGSLVDTSCTPTRAVPMIAFHGTADTEVPYGDSVETTLPRAMIAASAGLPPSVRFWAAANKCQRVAIQREMPHVVRARFTPCAGADVLFYSIDSGAHAWPGGKKDGPDGFEPSTEIRASDAMVSFFFRHPLR